MTEPATFPRSDLCGTEAEPLDIDRLYRTERPSLIRFFTRNRASPSDAEDLAQEAFARIAYADQDKVIEKPVGYLRQIGRNLLRDHASAPNRRRVINDDDMDRFTSDRNEVGRLEARDRLRRLEQALHHVRPRSRDIFLAVRLDGMSYADVAEETGLSVKRVEKIMSKTIGQLTRLMEQDN